LNTSTNANTILCGLVGAGIQRSLAPVLQEEEARQHGLAMRYRLFDLDVETQGLPELVGAARKQGYAGLNITYPCKQAVIPLLDELSDEARAIGAVNTIVRDGKRLAGYNTDGPGWSRGFRRELPGADLSRVVLIGAGGAGSACADAVLRLGASQLVIVDVEAARTSALVARLNANFQGSRATPGKDIRSALRGATGLIHATPMGMAKLPGMALPESLLHPSLWISEIVYVPLETAFLKAARRAGCRAIDGGHMNVGQAAMNFKLFTGREADAARMDAHFRRAAGA
jgi:shikimate dehydrogenase